MVALFGEKSVSSILSIRPRNVVTGSPHGAVILILRRPGAEGAGGRGPGTCRGVGREVNPKIQVKGGGREEAHPNLKVGKL